jgi:hypothetical protein
MTKGQGKGRKRFIGWCNKEKERQGWGADDFGKRFSDTRGKGQGRGRKSEGLGGWEGLVGGRGIGKEWMKEGRKERDRIERKRGARKRESAC